MLDVLRLSALIMCSVSGGSGRFSVTTTSYAAHRVVRTLHAIKGNEMAQMPGARAAMCQHAEVKRTTPFSTNGA